MKRLLIMTGLICVCAMSFAASTAPSSRPATGPARADSFELLGQVDKPGTWTVARLREAFNSDLHLVSYDVKGAHHQSECVSLDTFLKAAVVKVNTTRKSHVLAMVVTVVARDGYAASFGVGDLSPDIGNRAAWLALDSDGAPLADRDSPVKLIVPDDKKPARWVFGIATITVSDPTATP